MAQSRNEHARTAIEDILNLASKKSDQLLDSSTLKSTITRLKEVSEVLGRFELPHLSNAELKGISDETDPKIQKAALQHAAGVVSFGIICAYAQTAEKQMTLSQARNAFFTHMPAEQKTPTPEINSSSLKKGPSKS
ncbi:MAG: hypothetical protein ABI597_04680 [Gammaproteobacteria bacterium]